MCNMLQDMFATEGRRIHSYTGHLDIYVFNKKNVSICFFFVLFFSTQQHDTFML